MAAGSSSSHGPSPPRSQVSRILERARELGFELAGIADVRPSDHRAFYEAWLEEGHHGSMSYLARKDAVERRADLRRTLESVRSAVVVGHEYFRPDPPGVPENPSRAVIARYARGRDYHEVMEERLEALLEWIRGEAGREADFSSTGSRQSSTDGDGAGRATRGIEGRVYVDTGPIPERELAQRAGLGWFGKNTMLLNPRKGSYFFLGVLLLDLDLEPTGPFSEDRCGTCSRCLEACPTDALLGRDEDGAPVMNARRCISYLTIEHRGPIPRELRPLMGNRVYGCDICQEVCPFNVRFAEETGEEAYTPKPELDGPTLVELAERLLPMSENGFLREYSDSPVSRARRKGLLRNVCIGLGNWLGGERDLSEAAVQDGVDVLIRALNDDRPLVRGHAAWALGEVRRDSAAAALSSRLEIEEDAWVRDEIATALS